MTRERAIWVLAGSMILISPGLAFWISPWWHLLSVFVGVNLIQSAFTGFCPAEMIFAKLGLPAGGCTMPCSCGQTSPGADVQHNT
jgi:hypothetical protein